MDEPAEIGRRVARMRAERGLTQRALAEPSYTPAYISTLESGKVRPSETALRFLAERLGTSYEELATGRPAHLATELRLALTDAQRTLATGDAAEAAVRYRQLLAEAERLGLDAERGGGPRGGGGGAGGGGGEAPGPRGKEEAGRGQGGGPRPP
ncbi:helix-turn-helix domain-containing protein, partial [Streptomyces vinaceus]|uniref:helix-turn-helix domain-containing protein n=1 Tax=Streptomyces vinaceus TaxID=1960 RepID=UPI0036825CFC